MTNKLRLTLKNFQSISSGELDFETGLNFIIGQSNSGKTATFRALKTCLLNTIGSQRFIKRGTDKASVTLNYEGNEITWIRTPKESQYIINGSPSIKTGKSSAMKLMEDKTGFVEDNDVLMNIEEELQLPFPFGFSKSELFKLYENVFCVSDSSVILKSAKDYEDNTKHEIANVEAELAKTNTKISELQAFKNEVDLSKLKDYLQSLKSKKDKLEKLLDGLSIIKQAATLDNANIEVEVQVFNDKTLIYKELRNLKSLIHKLKLMHKLSKELPSFTVSPVDMQTYKELIALKKDISLINKLSTVQVQSTNVEDKSKVYKELCDLQGTLSKLKELHKLQLPSLSIESKSEHYNSLKKLKQDIQDIQSKVSTCETNKKQAEVLVKDIQSKLKSFKVCPLCHSKLES